ncbi:hypothetical protein AAHE18_15G050900 [Arachis hypogaea]
MFNSSLIVKRLLLSLPPSFTCRCRGSSSVTISPARLTSFFVVLMREGRASLFSLACARSRRPASLCPTSEFTYPATWSLSFPFLILLIRLRRFSLMLQGPALHI